MQTDQLLRHGTLIFGLFLLSGQSTFGQVTMFLQQESECTIASVGCSLGKETVTTSHSFSYPILEARPNSNDLIREYQTEIELTASTTWRGWPANKVVDGNFETSWFSAARDATSFDAKPWVKLQFPRDVSVRRVSIWGNREPSWPTGYSVKTARIELLNADGKVVFQKIQKGKGDCFDYDLEFNQPKEHIRSIRIVALTDQGSENPYSDIAFGEIEVE